MNYPVWLLTYENKFPHSALRSASALAVWIMCAESKSFAHQIKGKATQTLTFHICYREWDETALKAESTRDRLTYESLLILMILPLYSDVFLYVLNIIAVFSIVAMELQISSNTKKSAGKKERTRFKHLFYDILWKALFFIPTYSSDSTIQIAPINNNNNGKKKNWNRCVSYLRIWLVKLYMADFIWSPIWFAKRNIIYVRE